MKNVEDIYTLSPMQKGMLFHSLYAPEAGLYIEQIIWGINGQLNVSAFEQAWQKVVEHHPILRTAFIWEELDEPLQVVRQQVNLLWEQLDWRGLSQVEQEETLQAYLKTQQTRGFKLFHAPLMHLTLIQVADEAYQFIWSYHHLLLDGWSVSLVLQEIFVFYEGLCQGQNFQLEHSYPYKKYIGWLQQQDLLPAEKFWREALKGFAAPISLKVNPASKSLLNSDEDYAEQQIHLSETITTSLQNLARQNHLTLNTLVQGTWALLLNRYSGEEDIVFGVTISGRPPDLVGVESMVGLFINTLPLRVQVSPSLPLLSWLKKLQEQQVKLRQYEYSSLTQVQGWSEVPRGMPLFDSIVVFENQPVDKTLQQRIGSLEIRDLGYCRRTGYPLTIIAEPSQELSVSIIYDCRHFDAATITRMLGHFQTLLEGIVANPSQQLSDLLILSASERHQLLVEWNNTEVDYPHDVCVHELFEAQVEQTPDAVAVVFENKQLTYRELNWRANQLAHYLQELGIRTEVLVAICMERSLEMVVGLLGILKAGGAYVPLDPVCPQERLSFMLEDTQLPVVLTQKHLLEKLPEHKSYVVCLDTEWPLITQHSKKNLINKVTPQNLAYVIYTSGSTGRPKGAMNTHRAICNRLLWMQNNYQLTQADGVLQKTSFSFDVSVWEFFWPLLTGARLVVAKPGGHQDSTYLVELIAQQQLTTVHFVPSMLQVFLEEQTIQMCDCLRQVMCSGEALPFKLQERFFARLNAELHNLYGPTEAAVDVTSWACERESSQRIVPIGRPISNTQIYLLDAQLQQVPIGVPGELHIGGVSLARGYLNKAELTAEKFIPNPFSDEMGERLYKTGDLARYRPDGSIEYLGRIDHQVKIRGFRIELGEIEAVLSQHPAMRETVVMAHEDASGAKNLVAYIIPKHESSSIVSDLRSFLKEKLPDYMVPSAFVRLEALPLTPNGKLDRRSLPAPEGLKPELATTYLAPQTELEKIIANIWQEVLHVDKVGLHDNFFDLGGHSLLMVQVHSKLREVFDTDVSMTDLFKYPTISFLSKCFNPDKSKKNSFQKFHDRAKKQEETINRKKRLIKERTNFPE